MKTFTGAAIAVLASKGARIRRDLLLMLGSFFECIIDGGVAPSRTAQFPGFLAGMEDATGRRASESQKAIQRLERNACERGDLPGLDADIIQIEAA